MDDASPVRPTGPGSVEDRRQAIAELGDALRILVEQATATEASADELRRVAAQVREAGGALAESARTRMQAPSADDLFHGIRMYNPVSGPGSALAPPLHIDERDGGVIGTCTLGLAFEGPPTYAHGGVSALLMDQILGSAAIAAGHPGMTVSLVTGYRAPVPLQTPLRLTAEVTEVSGRKVTVQGRIVTAAEPDTVLVEATAIFVALNLEQARRLFGATLRPDPANPALAHD